MLRANTRFNLLFSARKEIEERIRRLGQKARAAGIHLVLAVQQPGREIVKGALQANIPARVGLRVTSRIESKMLLDRRDRKSTRLNSSH